MKIDTPFKHQLIGGSLALAATLPLALAPNAWLKTVAAWGLFGGIGYTAAATLLADGHRRRAGALADRDQALQRRESEAQAKIKADRHAIATERETVQRELAAAKAQAATVEAELKEQFEQQLQRARELLATAAHEHQYQLEQQHQQRLRELELEKVARVKAAKAQHRQYEQQLHARIAELEGMIVDNDAYLKAEFDKVLGDTDALLAGEIKGVKVAKAQALEEIQQRDLVIERLRGQVEALGAPRRFKGSSADDGIANQVLDILLAHGLALSADNWDRKYHQLLIWLEPKAAVLSEIEANLEQIQLALGLYARPTVEIDRGLYKLTLDTDQKVARATDIKIIDPPLTKLEQALERAVHVRIAANTGSGKSVLLGNLVNYLTSIYTPDYQLSDPKVTAPEVWGNLQPSYYSFECLDHLFGLVGDVMTRVDAAKDAVRAGQPVPPFTPQFHIFDELEMLYGLAEVSEVKEYSPKAFKNNVKLMLKAGREHRLKLLFVTQSPLPSDLNLRRNDFFNTSSILLGKCIGEALYSDDKDSLLADLPREKRALLKAEYKARLARGDDYIFLFYDPAQPLDAWFGRCPAPGHYAAVNTPVLATPDPVTQSGTKEDAASASQAVQPSPSGGELLEPAPDSTSASTATAPTTAPAVDDLETLLNAGTHCPDCGNHTARYSKRKPNGKGNVSLKCLNSECDRKTFTWKVI